MTWMLRRPTSRLSKIGAAVTIAVAFLRVAYGPAGGWSAVEFWLLLFYAAAMNGCAPHASVAAKDGDVDCRAPHEPRHDND